MTIYNLYIFDRHCQCIYYQKWHHKTPSNNATPSTSMSQTGHNTTTMGSSSRLGGLTTSSSRFSASSPGSSALDHHSGGSGTGTTAGGGGPASSMTRSGDDRLLQTQPSGLAAGSVMSIEEEAKLVYGVVFSLRNFVRKLSADQDEFISYRTSTYRLHYYETPTGLKFVMNSDANTESLRAVLKQIYVQLYVDFVVKNGLMKFEDTRWEISQGVLPPDQQQQQQQQGSMNDMSTSGNGTARPSAPPPGNICNELFRIAVDRFIRSLPVFE